MQRSPADPDEPSRREHPEPGPAPATESDIDARTQTEQANAELQEENAETALDQPSDGSGGE